MIHLSQGPKWSDTVFLSNQLCAGRLKEWVCNKCIWSLRQKVTLGWNHSAVTVVRSSHAHSLPPVHFIFSDDLNENASWFPSPTAQPPPMTASLVDCTGVMCCLLHSRMIYSLEGKKINKQAVSTPALCLEGKWMASWGFYLPSTLLMPHNPGWKTARSEEKKLFYCGGKRGEKEGGSRK